MLHIASEHGHLEVWPLLRAFIHNDLHKYCYVVVLWVGCDDHDDGSLSVSYLHIWSSVSYLHIWIL